METNGSVDQLNSTVHGTMKTTPYELVFGQPPRQNIFPGVHGSKIMEEDVEDILHNSLEEKQDFNPNDLSESEFSSDADANCTPEPMTSPNAEMAQQFDSDCSQELKTKMKLDADYSPAEPSLQNEMKQKLDLDGSQEMGPSLGPSPDSEIQIIDSPGTELKQDISMQSGSPKDKLTDDSKSNQLSNSDTQTNLDDNDAVFGYSKKHLRLRQEADERYRRNAERMKMKYCKAKHKKVATFNPGDFVSIKIPRIDRTSTDIHRLPCIVVEQLGSKYHLYRLR